MINALNIFGFCIAGLICFTRALTLSPPPLCPSALQRSRSPDIDPSFEGKLPIEWVHVPKTGSSFLNTLLRIEGACPNLPNGLGQALERLTIPPSWCNASVLDTDFSRTQHGGIDFRPGFNAGKGRFMMFMRQPEQRLLSQIYFKTDVVPDPEKYMPFEPAVEQESGCVTKMLVGALPCCTCAEGPTPTRAQVDEAKIRLQTSFSFIGMTEQWDLSMCLFNAMFNQRCRYEQFANIRPSAGQQSTTYDIASLSGYQDPYDGELYQIGTEIFNSNLRKYNVSESSCELCRREAGVL